MPRDEHAVVEPTISLPGFRRARACPADDAGETRLHILDGDWLDRLLCLGLIDQDQHQAGVVLAGLYEATNLRDPIASAYDGIFVDGRADTGCQLERMNRGEARAWRRLHRLLSFAPLFSRGEVEAVAIHGLRPVSVARLRVGLRAVASALARGR